jgi:hypothetical protein
MKLKKNLPLWNYWANLSQSLLKWFLDGPLPKLCPVIPTSNQGGPRFGLFWFSGFRGEDLNVIFYQNMPNLHNRYKSAERKISQKNPEYMLNCSLPCSCSKNLSSFRFMIKQQWTIEEISIFSNSSHLEWREDLSDTILNGCELLPSLGVRCPLSSFRRTS